MNAITDKELLELAAKAAGIDIYVEVLDSGWYELTNRDTLKVWNPLSDDGDALRLAVKLRMQIEPARTTGGKVVEIHAYICGRGDCAGLVPIGADDNYATRRAITEAAAELGKEMK